MSEICISVLAVVNIRLSAELFGSYCLTRRRQHAFNPPMKLVCCCRWAIRTIFSLEKENPVLSYSRQACFVFPQVIVPLGCISVVHICILISESEHDSTVLGLHSLQHLNQDGQDVEVCHVGPNLAFEDDEDEINANASSDDITIVEASAPVS